MPSGAADQPTLPAIVHATCISLSGRGLLIKGASGSGKSALALQLLAYGCKLVADDRVVLSIDGGNLMADAPPSLPKMIEARGIGLIPVVLSGPARLVAAVDMDTLETDRLPEKRDVSLIGQNIPLYYKVEEPHFAAGLVQMLKQGWRDPK